MAHGHHQHDGQHQKDETRAEATEVPILGPMRLSNDRLMLAHLGLELGAIGRPTAGGTRGSNVGYVASAVGAFDEGHGFPSLPHRTEGNDAVPRGDAACRIRPGALGSTGSGCLASPRSRYGCGPGALT